MRNSKKTGSKGDQKRPKPRSLSAQAPQKDQHKSVETSLLTSEERFQRLFETAQDGILLLDAETGVITEANPFIQKLLGYTREELVGKKLWNVSPFKNMLASQKAFRKLQAEGYIRYEDLPLETKDGRRCDVEFVSNVYKVGRRKVIQCNIRDITDRMRVGEEINQLAKFPSENPYPVLRLDRDGTILYANKASQGLLSDWGCAQGEAAPKFWQQSVAEALERQENRIVEIESSGKILSFFVVPITDAHYVNLYGSEVTERRQVEESLRSRVEQLSALNQASQAVAVSLDLNQVLTEVVSLAGRVSASDFASVLLVDEKGASTRGVENLPGVPTINYRLRKKGFTHWIVRMHQPVVVDEIRANGGVSPLIGGGAPHTANPFLVARGIKSFVGLPLMVKDRVLGVLYLHSLHPGAFCQQLPLLTTFANQAAIAIEKARLYEAVRTELDERKQAEDALRASEARFSTVFRASSLSIAIIRIKDNTFVDFNEAFQSLSGFTREDAIGRSAVELNIWVNPAERDELIKTLGNKGSMYGFEVQLRGKSGDIRDLLMSAELIELANEPCILTIGIDITERKRAEEARQESEERYRLLFDLSPDAIVVYQDGKVVFANPAAARLLGAATPEELIGRPMLDLVHPDYHNLVTTRSREQTVKAGPVPIVEEKFIRLDGTSIDVEVTAAPFRYQGNPAVLVIVRDITERRQAQEALRQSEERFREIFENMSSGVVVYEAVNGGEDFRIEGFNRAAEIIEKIPREAILGKTVLEIFPGVRALGLFEVFQRVWKTGRPEHLSASFYQDEREAGWRENYVAKLSPSEIVVVYDDVTERMQAERALKESEERYRRLFDASPVGIGIADLNGNVLTSNSSMEKITGYTVEELKSKGISSTYVNPEERQHLFGILQEKGAVRDWEIQLRRKNGSIFTALLNVDQIELGGQKVVYTLVRDITEHKQAEQALRESEARFRGAVEAAGAVPYFLSYETEAYTFMGEGILALTGYPVQEMTPALFRSLVQERYTAGEEAHLSPEEAAMQMRAGRIKNWRCDVRIVARDGRNCWIADASIPVFDKDGKVIGSTGFLQDITERKRTEETLARQTEELNQRNKEMDRLYRASGSLISSSPFNLQTLAQIIVEVILQEFGQSNCSVFLVSERSNKLNRIAVAGPYAEQVSRKVLTLDGTGLVPQAIRSGQVINTPDVGVIPAYLPAWETARSELTIPLKIGSQVIGAIDVQSAEQNYFSADDERLMTIFAERAALSLEHTRLFAQTERRMRNMMSLRTIDLAISSSFDLEITLGILLDQVIRQMGVHAADVLVFNPVTQTFRFSNGQGFHTQALRYTDLRLGDGYAGQAARERHIVTIQDLDKNPSGLQRSAEFLREGFICYVGVPLIAKGQIKGVLEIFHRQPLNLDEEESTFLETLAGQAAIAIDNTELFNNLQSSNTDLILAYENTLAGWASALELRDKETEGHTRRVANLTARLAQAVGINPAELIHIHRGALLHDIGKMGIPDSIVLKPGPLTEAEWVIMRKHPEYAFDMISPISYLQQALDIPYCHHEKWDGTGYPRKLKGEQIPLAARVFAVVDVWDALTSDRPYRKAWPEDKARAYLREQAGKHFDPGMVKVFLDEVLSNEA